MTDETFERRFDEMVLTSQSAPEIEVFPRLYVRLRHDTLIDMEGATTAKELQTGQERLKRIKGVLFLQTVFMAGMAVGAVEQGLEEAKVN